MRWDRPLAPIRQATAALLALLGVALMAETAVAQPQLGNLLPNPRLYSVTPCGGKAGTTFEVTFNGFDLDQPQELLFSHPGIKAKPIIPPAPPPPKAPPKGQPAPKPPPPPPITKFSVTIGPDVPLGIHDVRFVNQWGVSNPRAFVVGDLTEVAEKEPNDDVDKAQRVEINSTVNGVIANPTDVDYFVFAGKKGQRVVVSCLASSIDSRLDANLRVFDSEGRQVAANRNYLGGDALADVTLAEDGDYLVRLCQFTYTGGGPDYFYRLSITTAPWIDAVQPPMIEPGKTAEVTVYGRNLPGGKLDKTAVVDGRVLEKVTVRIKAPDDRLATQRLAYSGRKSATTLMLNGFEYRIRNEAGSSNPFLIGYARAPVVLDNEANDTPETAQEIPVPCEVAGRVEKRGDRDWYAFQAKKGETLSIEVICDRLGAPADMYFILRNPATKQVFAEVDPNNEALIFSLKFYTSTEDPGVFNFTAPADGTYQIMVASRTGDSLAGPRHFYRLRITPAQPDFHVVLMPPDNYRPDGCTLRQGGNAYYSAFIWRHDGFTGDVTLTAEDLPKGVTCPPQTLGGGVKVAKVALSAAADAPVWTGHVKFKATATIKGQSVVHECRYASIIWPVPPAQNIRTAARFEQALALAVRDKAPYNLSLGIDKSTVVQGGKVTVPLKLTRLWQGYNNNVQIVPDQRELPPNLVNHPPVNIGPGATAGSLVLNVNSGAQPGTYNIVFRSFSPVPFKRNPKAPNSPTVNVNVVQGTTPLVLTILPKQVARISLANSSPTIKLGMQAEVLVRVTRLFNYDGEFKVQLVLPPNIQGLSAADVTIPAGQNEAKLVVKVDANAAPGNRPNLTVKTTALYNGTVPLTVESKINVNVVK
jgi:hypothetical protein